MDLVDANMDLPDADRDVADANITWTPTQFSAKWEEMTGEFRKLHNNNL